MSKFNFVLALCLSTVALLSAQNDEKVKGSRDVSVEQDYLDGFNKIVVGDDFSVEIIYNAKPSIEVEADDNLHEHIKYEVVDSVLTIQTISRITSKRRMNVTINYSNPLKQIEVKDDAEIRSLTSLEFGQTLLKTSGSSKAYLNINSDDFTLIALDKSRLRLNVTAKDVNIETTDNAKLEALINCSALEMKLFERSTADIEGTASEVTMRADNNSKFDGKNFTTQKCDLVSEIDSEVYIDVTDKINIQASGTCQVYLYSEPKINLDRFTDSAKLQMKSR